MMFVSFTLIVAILISMVSAFYSVLGLTVIFSASFWPIVIMGSVLEVGKITSTIWLHKYWDTASWYLKAYLIPAIIGLMLITSIGVYGFLSKAHSDQAVPAGDIVDKVSIIDEKIKTYKDNIDTARKAVLQMDSSVDQIMARTTSEQGASRAVRIRKTQAKERAQLQQEITQAQREIAKLREERAPIATDLRKIEAEVGPLKYIAALIYGDAVDSTMLDRAVRWLIILLVSVFDPLAVILLLACQHSFDEINKRQIVNLIQPGHNKPVPLEEIKQNVDNSLVTGINNTGTEFPDNPVQGYSFIRTDFNPPKEFTYNGSQWVDTQSYHQ